MVKLETVIHTTIDPTLRLLESQHKITVNAVHLGQNLAQLIVDRLRALGPDKLRLLIEG